MVRSESKRSFEDVFLMYVATMLTTSAQIYVYAIKTH